MSKSVEDAIAAREKGKRPPARKPKPKVETPE
jgi:hypothetical protein